MSNGVVLDTTVIVKGLLKPYQRLPPQVYDRELETHRKCRFILNRLEEAALDTFIPLVCVVEVAAVFNRLTGNEELALSVSSKIRDSYVTVDEERLFENAWKIAAKTGSSGFDSYFLALASTMNTLLITDDENMAGKGTVANIETILVRKSTLKELSEHLKRVIRQETYKKIVRSLVSIAIPISLNYFKTEKQASIVTARVAAQKITITNPISTNS